MSAVNGRRALKQSENSTCQEVRKGSGARQSNTFLSAILTIAITATGNFEVKQVYSAARKTYQYEIRQAKLKTNAAFIEGAVNKCSAAKMVIKQERSGTNIRAVSVTPDKLNEYFLDVAEEAVKNVQAAPRNPMDMARRANAPVEDM
ncbi:hypothetical protein J6590_047226 [Homalodisca vitripennis]|nr:hypothetical protein J6590_047226 [Homalodisca vitripennis]